MGDDVKHIWVIGGRDGYTVGDETIELMTEADELGRKTDCRITVALFGSRLEEATTMLARRRSADRLAVFQAENFTHYDPLAYVAALTRLAREAPPDIILLSATSMGRDLAPRLAVQLKGDLISNVQQLQFSPNGTLKAIKPVYGGKANAVCRFSDSPPSIVTIVPGVIGVSKKKGSRNTEVVMQCIPENGSFVEEVGYQVADFIKADPRTIDIVDADVVVAGGRGIDGAEGFRALETFAHLIGGAVGCSRPVVDQGILKLERQIGQTGQTVSPDLFISCGISGAMQHEMGMKDAKHIIAINTDTEAPVFRIADCKVVCDANALIPHLIAGIEARRSQNEKHRQQGS